MIIPQHYQSFRPGHGFWLDLDFVEDLVRQGKKEVRPSESSCPCRGKKALTLLASCQLPHPPATYERLLASPLVSFRDGKEYSNMPKLKAHLKDAWTHELHRRRLAGHNVGNDGKLQKTSASPHSKRAAERRSAQSSPQVKSAKLRDSSCSS